LSESNFLTYWADNIKKAVEEKIEPLRKVIGTEDWENLVNGLGQELQNGNTGAIKKAVSFVDASVREDVAEDLVEVFINTVDTMIDGVPETEADEDTKAAVKIFLRMTFKLTSEKEAMSKLRNMGF
jgi:hypothetical protein